MRKHTCILRIATLGLVLVLLCGLLCSCKEKEDTLVSGLVSGEYTYTRSENTKTARISQYKGSATALEIPKMLDNLPVVGIEKNAFAENKVIKQVTFPTTVEWIETGAFKNCSALTTVKLGDSLQTIGSYAFSECVSLTAVSLPDTVTTIGDNAFSGCAALENVLVGKNITSVGVDAFYGTQWFASLKEEFVIIGDGVLIDYNGKKQAVTLPKTVKHISSAFVNDLSVQNVVLPEGLEKIDDYAFQGCSSLVSVTIPKSVTSIGMYAFARCISLSGITIPDTVTEIGTQAFSGCISLRSLTIPSSVTSISEKTFMDCTGLSRVSFETTIESIEKGAFSGCGGINVVAYAGKKTGWDKVKIAEGNETLSNALLSCAK